MNETLEDTLIRHEGLRLTPYRCTAGKLTIGIGRNLDDAGISEAEARLMLRNDIVSAEAELRRAFRWFDRLSPLRQQVLVNMAFNLGLPRLQHFRRMLTAIEQGHYSRAAAEMLDSRWARQVKGRATELARWMRTGNQDDPA